MFILGEQRGPVRATLVQLTIIYRLDQINLNQEKGGRGEDLSWLDGISAELKNSEN